MPAAVEQIVVYQCHRSCRNVEVEQIVQFLDQVDDVRCCTVTGAWCLTEHKTVEVLQLQCSDKVDDVPVVQVVVWVSWKVPQIQFIARVCGPSVCNETMGFQRGYGGDSGVGIFRAPPGCPGVERQFSEPSMMKSSSSSRAPAQLVRSRLWTYTPHSVTP